MGRPRRRIWLIGHTLSSLIAHVPGSWRLLRGPTSRFWEKAAARWDTGPGADPTVRIAPLAAACDRLPEPPADILEIGTGTGVGALYLAGRFTDATVTGVDLAENMVAAARAKVTDDLADRLTFEAADAAALPFADDSFDLVAQVNVPIFPAEVARVLRPGGSFVVASTHGPATPYYTSERVLRRKLRKHGLVIESSGRAGDGTYAVALKRG